MDNVTAKRIGLLHPLIRDEVAHVLSGLSLSQSVSVRITQGLRTFAEQDALFAKGRTAPGRKVTNASGGQSIHNYGLAFDYVLLRDGKVSWDVDKDWKQVAATFKEHGWQWGGDWKAFKDWPHLEKTFGYSWQQLLAKHRHADFIPGTKYVNL